MIDYDRRQRMQMNPSSVIRPLSPCPSSPALLPRGLIVAAPASRSGKTTVALAIMAALARRGVPVRAAKAGPDYIDPAFHAAATGAASLNLDSWAMPPQLLDAVLGEAAAGAAIVIIEGAMGLFDGAPGNGVAHPHRPDGPDEPGRDDGTGRRRRGSTADLAARFGLPVLLVLDVAGQSQTAAAVARGLASHDEAVRIAAVVLNRVGSERHRALVADAMAACGIAVLGAIPRERAIVLPERHLGLVQAGEHADLAALFAGLADIAERHLDLDCILAVAAPLPQVYDKMAPPPLRPPGQRIALAADAAFSFVYPHVLSGWRRAGAEITAFSPLADEPPPALCDACWLPGGYPELHAGALAAARRFRAGILRFAETRPVHGECGGYMVLGNGLVDADGNCHAMLGLLSHVTSFASRKLHLGYRRARLRADGPLGAAGAVIRGHEFHYASLLEAGDDECFADLADAAGNRLGGGGGRRRNVTGTFFHAVAAETADDPPAEE
jgi:cobyrinic acid a,c-diamide synthase